MTTLYIPRLRDKLKLTADWTFPVYFEHRNEGLIARMGYGYDTVEREVFQSKLPSFALYGGQTVMPKPFTMPAGTELSVDRVFIRNGAAGFDSVTFRCKLPKGKKATEAIRFWAKLEDINGKLQFEPVTPAAKP